MKNRSDWESVYKKIHPNWCLSEKAVYGIPELHRDEIIKTDIVANPGCYASSAILSLAPLLHHDIVDRSKIIVDGLSGTAGAGDDLDPALHHPAMHNNLLPYNVVDHRHTYEIEQELSLISKKDATVHFSACYVPMTRGILTISHCFPSRMIKRNDLLELYKDFYKEEYFIKVIDIPKDSNAAWNYLPYPWVSAVSSTNFCHIGLDIDEKRNRIVIYGALDSIGKGGALAGIQNMNLLFGLDERTGLDSYGIYPY